MGASAPKIQDWVIDTDTHIAEPGDLWTSRLPAKYKDRAPHIVRDPETGVETWRIGDGPRPAARGLRRGGRLARAVPRGTEEHGRGAEGHLRPGRASRVHGPGGDLGHHALPERGRFWQPGIPRPEGSGADARLRPRLQRLPHRLVSPDPRRLLPITATPFWDVEASVKEIERCAKLGHRGVLFTGEPQSHNMPILASSHWNPLWEAAQACDLPVSFHIGTGTFDDGFTPERIEMTGRRQDQRLRRHVALPRQRQAADGSALLGHPAPLPGPQVRVRRSRDRLHPLHPRILRLHLRVRAGAGGTRPEFKLKPSEYFARQVYGCYIFEEFARAAVGIDRCRQHPVRDRLPAPGVPLRQRAREDRRRAGKAESRETQRKILFENAAKLYVRSARKKLQTAWMIEPH